ncbi:hypothetical protein [Vibrio sp. Evd11]|uniref:hypothetical protein n=1 Tax=Vibrio sp. Evd11 TaxID=1207404 RepID=UPI000EFCAE0C|nr:hypothetical protein [Vibrio sp. Evd11]
MEIYEARDIYFSAAIKALESYVDDPTSITVVRASKVRQFIFNEMIDPPTLYVTTHKNEENMRLYLPFTQQTKANYNCPKPHADFTKLLVDLKGEWNKNILKKFGESAFTDKNGLMDVTLAFDRSLVKRAINGRNIKGLEPAQDKFALQLFFHHLSNYMVVRYSWDDTHDMARIPNPLAYNLFTKCLCWFKELSLNIRHKKALRALRKQRQSVDNSRLG